ncbi:MAG: PilW family protein [Pseudomonadota bacterium]
MKPTLSRHLAGSLRQRGFSLVELMISITISLIILAGLSAMLVNISRSNNEMARSNSQIENGRFAIQVLEHEIVHAGFWGEYVPQFDDLSWLFVASDSPVATLPSPCRAYLADDHDASTTTDWDFNYINSMLGLPIQVSADAPAGCTLDHKADNTDVIVVRHGSTCLPGEPNCEDDLAGKLYLQSSMCAEGTYGTTQTGTTTTAVVLPAPSSVANTSSITDAYRGATLRMLSGTQAGQTRTISGYVGTNYTATVSPAFATAPADGDAFTIVNEVLSTDTFPLRKKTCLASAPAVKRKFESNMFYIRDYAATVGDGIPTLVRSSFDLGGTPAVLAHQAPEALVEGIERFSVELGIDDTVKRCPTATLVSDTVKVARISPTTCLIDTVNDSNNTLPTNRGDGNADRFVQCTTAAPCLPAVLRNAVEAKIFLLVRSTEPTPGYTDSKTYCLASLPVGGTCPDTSTAGPFSDGYKRHLFSTTIRLTSISGRRETP